MLRAVVLLPLSGGMNKNLSGPTAKQRQHIEELRAAQFRRRRKMFLPDATLKALAGLRLPPDKAAYNEALKRLLRSRTKR
jgi:hypothetical protein